MSNDYQALRYAIQGNTAIITLNRPEQLNAWNKTMADEFQQAIAAAEGDARVVGIVITGAGRAFCAGADMGSLTAIAGGGAAAEGVKTQLDNAPGDPDMPAAYRATFSFLASVRKPVIAAVNGAAAGMALPLILFCDMRFFARSGFVLSAFAQRGLIAEYGTSWILPRIVGLDNALDILYSSRKIHGEEAREIGLATRLCADEEVVQDAVAYVETLAKSCAPQSLRQMKAQVYRDLCRDPAEAFEEADKMMLEGFGGEDMKEGVAAYTEKRPPHFARVGE